MRTRDYYVRDLDYCYDPYHDVIWFSFVDLSQSCGFGVPMDRRTDIIEAIDIILSGEYKQWLDDF